MAGKLLVAAATALSSVAALAPAAGAQRHGGPGYGYRAGRGDDDRGSDRRDDPARRCADGSAATIIGAIAGGLLGGTIDARGDQAPGTAPGASGALTGRGIGRPGGGRDCR